MEDGHSCPSPEAAQDKWRSVGAVEESNRTMDILVRRRLPLRSWQAEESRTRMSKVLRKHRLPWPSGLIPAAFGVILLRIAEHAVEAPSGKSSYHPRMMLVLLLYFYCIGVFSSRKIVARCETDVAFRVIVGDNIPDFRTITQGRPIAKRRGSEPTTASECFAIL